MNLKELWALEYSAEQKSFNIDMLENILTTNLNACLNKKTNDYQIILIAKEQECRDFCEKLEEKINK